MSSRMRRPRFTRVFSPPDRRSNRLGAHLVGDAQAVGHLVHRRVGVPAAQSLEPGVQLARSGGRVASSDCALLHAEGQRVHLVLHAEHPGEGGLQHVLHRVARGIDRDLRDQPHPPAGGDLHRAAVVVQLAGEDLEQRGLARAVAAQQAHPLPGVDLERQAVQYFLFQIEGLHQSLHANVDHLALFQFLYDVFKMHGVGRLYQHGRTVGEGGADGGHGIGHRRIPLGAGGGGRDVTGLLADGDDRVQPQLAGQRADGAVSGGWSARPARPCRPVPPRGGGRTRAASSFSASAMAWGLAL